MAAVMDSSLMFLLGITTYGFVGDIAQGQTIVTEINPRCAFVGNVTTLQCTVSGTGLAPRWKNPAGKDVSSGCSILDGSVKSISCDDNDFPSEVNITVEATMETTFFGIWECSIDSTTFQTLSAEALYSLQDGDVEVTVLDENQEANITCQSKCTYPVPEISWYNLNELGNITSTESTTCSMSNLTVGTASRTEQIRLINDCGAYHVVCVARQNHTCFWHSKNASSDFETACVIPLETPCLTMCSIGVVMNGAFIFCIFLTVCGVCDSVVFVNEGTDERKLTTVTIVFIIACSIVTLVALILFILVLAKDGANGTTAIIALGTISLALYIFGAGIFYCALHKENNKVHGEEQNCKITNKQPEAERVTQESQPR